MEARAAVPHITKKFAAYIAIAEQGIHRSHFGFCKFFVTFITSTAACMNSMVQRSLATSDSGRLANHCNEEKKIWNGEKSVKKLYAR
jgi:hypothetical protein